MPYERSAGAIIYHRRQNKVKYLLLEYRQKHWDFPRGHVETGESDEQAARREIREETGLTDLIFTPGFKEKISWFYRIKDDQKPRYEEAVYFLAKCREKAVKLSAEHTAFKWLTFAEAVKQLTFINGRDVLKKAHTFLSEYEKS